MNNKARKPSHEVSSLKAKALNAASHVLATRGVDDLNLRVIAETAGIGIASMYHYFDGKDDLLLTLATRGFQDLRRNILAPPDLPASASPMQKGHWAFFTFAQSNPALFSLMFDERIMARHESLRETEHETYLAYEAAVRADTHIPEQHQNVAAFALWALGRGMAAILSSYPGGRPPQEVVEKLFLGASYLLRRQ